MKFSHFLSIIPKLQQLDTDGIKAHEALAPTDREINYKKEELLNKSPQNAGVMALFYPNKAEETMLILILRKTYKGVHSGQIGFPGGKEEIRDQDIQETALRETYEEVGVRPSSVITIKQLSELYIPTSNFWVHPFVGYVKNTPQFKRQESEVEELLPISIDDFLNDKNLVTQKLTTHTGKEIQVPAFSLNQKIIWGATAMMLNEVKSLLRKAQ